jgi:hypothetical protein
MTDTVQETPPSQTLNWFGGLIAFLLIVELYGLTYGFMFVKIPTENTSNISQITGAVLLQVGIIIGWFFRSSQEAKKQAETISTMATAAAKAQEKLAPVLGAAQSDKTVTLPAGDTVAVHAEGEKP